MEKTLEFTQYGGGRYACTFTAAGGKSLIQVIRQKQGLIYIEAGADTEHLTYLESAGRFKDVLCEIEVPAGTVVRVVSHTPVEYAAYMAGEEGKSGDYYTKAEVDELIVGIHQFEPVVASYLPTASADTMYKLFFVPKSNPEEGDASDEYITVRRGEEGSYTYAWEHIGGTAIDLSGYATFAYVDGKFIPIPDPLPANADGTVIENIVQDYDGNWYDGVVIGNQIWLAQNLRTTHYADGTTIPFGGIGAGTEINPYSVLSDTDPYYYYPKGNAQNVNKYGILYNWPAVTNADGSSEKDDIAPNGFHVMTMTEFAQLIRHLSSQQRYWSDGETSTYIMKAIAADHDWPESSVQYAIGNDLTKNNASGFSLLPATCINVLYFGGGTELWTKDAGGYENTGTAYVFDKDGYELKTSYAIARSSRTGSSVRCVCDLTASEWFAANGSRYLKNTQQGLVWAKLAAVAKTGSYNDLDNKPAIPTVPTNVSDFNNDAGYLTQHQDISGKTDKVQNATGGNLAGLDANGNITDSGITPSELHDVRIPGFQSGDEHKVLCVNAAHNGVDLVDITEMAMPPDYLTMTAAVDNSTVHLISQLTSAPNIEYSIGNAPFEEMTWTLSNGTYTSETITLAFGQRVRFRGVNQTLCTDVNTADEKLTRFVLTGGIMASGSVQTLVDKTGATSNAICMKRLFSGNSALLTAPKLPATNLVPGCYDSIFYDDDNLIAPPDELPATVLTPNCYSGYCYNCSKLTHASNLPATVYATMACNSMYHGCTFAMSADGTTFNFIMGLTSIKVGNSTYNTPKAIARDVLRNDTGFN